MKKTFGEFLKERRLELGLTQGSFPGFSQGYISNIERGESNPTQRESIKKLAQTLQLPEIYIDYLWIYSILDYDPLTLLDTIQALQNVEADRYHVNETPEEYSIGIQIGLGDTPDMVLRKLGSPSERLQGPTKMKWIYKDRGMHITFVEDRVIDVDFK